MRGIVAVVMVATILLGGCSESDKKSREKTADPCDAINAEADQAAQASRVGRVWARCANRLQLDQVSLLGQRPRIQPSGTANIKSAPPLKPLL